MEIKVQCDCGQKFKFDVEPVNGQMPFVVNCPVCGADGTAKANVLLQQMLPPPPASAASAPAAVAPAPMRINRPAPPAAAPPPEATEESEIASEDEDSDGGSVREVKLGWKIWGLLILFIGLGLIGTFDKWSRRISVVKDIIQFVRGFSSSDSQSTAAEAGEAVGADWTLPDDNGVMMLVRHTNETAVAEACAEALSQQLKTKVAPVKLASREPDAVDANSLYVVDPAFNGCVALSGGLAWDESEVRRVDDLVAFVSKRLSTTAVGALMDDDAEFGIFFIYQNGERKFRLDRSFKIQDGDLQEVVKLEGEAWATEAGFKPGDGGFKGFTMADANALTEHLGLKLSGRPEPASCIILRSGAKP